MQTTDETLFYLWLIILIFSLVVLFVAKLKFNEIYEKREERRRLLSYSKIKLNPNEEGFQRSLKIKKLK